MEDITPQGPASLSGQYYERISQHVESPLKVTAWAMEVTDQSGHKDQVIMVSLDVVCTPRVLQDTLKDLVSEQLPDFDTRKLFLNATHTHSAPGPDIRSEYGRLLLEKLTKAVVSAWVNRKPAGVSYGLSYAVVGHNRRATYANGTAEMYGDTARPDFIGIEGPNDPGVDMLFCWDLNKNLTGIIINVSCPSQVTESKYYVSADYWSEVRKQVGARFSEDVYVFPQCGAAGDISPRDLPTGYRAGEPNMWDVPGSREIGKRLAQAIGGVYADARNSIQTETVFQHIVKDIGIPTRRVSKEEYQSALAKINEVRSAEPADADSPDTAWNRFLQEVKDNEKIREFGPWDDKKSDYGWLRPQEIVVNQYENQDINTIYKMELHVLRIGEIAMATNPFELFVDYGFAITGRSSAKQTFIVQLSGDYGGYLATEKALSGGGYSAMANEIGYQGGHILVDDTVELINSMWQK